MYCSVPLCAPPGVAGLGCGQDCTEDVGRDQPCRLAAWNHPGRFVCGGGQVSDFTLLKGELDLYAMHFYLFQFKLNVSIDLYHCGGTQRQKLSLTVID